MFLPVEVLDLHEKPSVAAIETLFKLLVQGPGLTSMQKDVLNTCHMVNNEHVILYFSILR